MLFNSLALYFEKLEQTSSRLSLIDILAELFSKVKFDEIGHVSYLLQGRVAPFFEPLEMGMSEKLVAASIARAYRIDREEVLKEYGRVGDLGLVAEKLSDAHGHPERLVKDLSRMRDSNKLRDSSPAEPDQNDRLSVNDVFETLRGIAKTTGEGTVEKKISTVAGLLEKVNGISAKHLVRIPLGVSRLGVGDPTILDAFALYKLGDKSKRKFLEGAYNRTSDLGLIGETLWNKGLKGVEKLSITVGRPIRSQLAERLPTAEKVIEKLVKVNAQRKLDGFRCITGFTPVYVKGKGVTTVRDVRVGDYVLTKTGAFKQIVAKYKRTIKKGEKLFKFKTFLGEEFGISEGHLILCFQQGKETWKPVEFIKAGDEVVFPVPQFPPNNPHPAPTELELKTISGYTKTFNLNQDFYRFLGFWIGDGFTNDFHNTERVGLLFNNKTEKELSLVYGNILKTTLQVSVVTRYLNKNNCLSLYWRDEPLKHWLSTYFRRAWSGKMIPEWFSHVSRENFQEFLQGWIESDGWVDKDGVTKIVTKERDLASFAQLIGLSHGIIIGLHYIRINYKLGRHTDNPVRKTCYQLVIPKTSIHARLENNRIIIKVLRNREIKNRDPRTNLYDLQVEDDESFCVPMATLHNCQIHKDGENIRLFSRNLEETTLMFPEIVEGAKKQIKVKTAILDAEAIGYNPVSDEFLPFQETTQRRRKYNIEEMAKKIPLKAFVFDVLYWDGKSLIDEVLTERLKVLKKLGDGDILFPENGEEIDDPKKLQTLLDDAISHNLEGLVVKRLDSKYEAGARNFNWVKLKRHSSGELQDTIDCVVLGYIFGRGKRTSFGAGALLVGVYDKDKDEFVTVSKIGTGLTDKEFREIHKRADKIRVDKKPARVSSILTPSVWIKPFIVIEVLADEITRSPVHTAGKTETEPGYALRFPRLIKFREADKKAEDATTVKELKEMFKQQFLKI